MKNIKYFKYKNTNAFEELLSACDYKIEDVEGFSVIGKKQRQGNVLKVYTIWFKDCHEEYFKVVYFKSFNEYYQSKLGFNGNKLLRWFEDANVRLCK